MILCVSDLDYCVCRWREIFRMTNSEETGSPGWGASFFMQTREDVARAVAAAAAAATASRSPRPSVVFSSKDDTGGSPIEKMQRQFTRVLKGFSQPPEVKSANYNPEVLTSQKRQWASCQLQYLVCYFVSVESSKFSMEEVQQAVTDVFSEFEFIQSFHPACLIRLFNYSSMMTDKGHCSCLLYVLCIF